MTPVEPAVSGRLGPPASRRLLTGSAGRRPALPIGSADLRQGSGDHRHEARLDADVPAPAPAVDRLDEQALVLRIGAHDVELGVEGAVGVEGQLALFLAVLVSPCLLRVFVGPPAVPGSGGQRGRLVAQTLLRAPPRAGLAPMQSIMSFRLMTMLVSSEKPSSSSSASAVPCVSDLRRS
jgi:hypothetical protein